MKHKETFANEMRYAESLIEDIPNERIRRRVETSLMWYIHKAKRSRIAYYVLSIISIAASAVIPVINTVGAGSGGGLTVKDTIISLVAAIGGVAVSICTLFNLKEAWNRNRSYAERLKQELFYYRTRSNNYTDKPDSEAEKEFIRCMEGLNDEESKSWAEANKKSSLQG